ncbi:MAG: GTP-binding protein [Candidatus Helarchaeota archaeon]|nr:GTP-binding protein [Candidatus Helarchaeota archaeon]
MHRFTFKLVLLGDMAVGKTSLVLRFINNTFSDKYITTIGADFLIKDLELLGAPVRLMIWDLGGQVQYEGVRSRYMQGSDGCILVFDVSRKGDVEGYISQWLGEIHDFIGDPPVIVVGNKIDLPPQVDLKKAAKLVQDSHHFYIETSAKTGNAVEAMFKGLTAEIIKRKAKKLKEFKGEKEEVTLIEEKEADKEDSKISDLFNKIREKH